MYGTEEKPAWDLHLPDVCLAHQTAHHEALRMSPFEVMYGVQANMPSDILLPSQPNEASSNAEAAQRMWQRLRMLHELARNRVASGMAVQKRWYDKHRKELSYEDGDLVAWRKPIAEAGQSTLEKRPWQGPFVVTRRLTPVTYEIATPTRKNQSVGQRHRVPVNRLKKWYARQADLLDPTPSGKEGAGSGGSVTGQKPGRTGNKQRVGRSASFARIRERRSVLDAWEAERRPECWVVVWLAYREAAWTVPDLAQPVTANEWVALRRWAKNFVHRWVSENGSLSHRYPQLVNVSVDQLADTVVALDEPDRARERWPHQSPAPDTVELRAEAIAALASRLVEIGALP
jgi:hypothetical protein